MPKYIVNIWREDGYEVPVEAANKEEAEEKATEAFDSSADPSRDFRHTAGDQSVVGCEEIK